MAALWAISAMHYENFLPLEQHKGARLRARWELRPTGGKNDGPEQFQTGGDDLGAGPYKRQDRLVTNSNLTELQAQWAGTIQ